MNMAARWKLKRTVQCAKCPWRVDVDPFDIPNGYDPDKHAGLKITIATPGQGLFGPVRAMACHETDDAHCVGWLANQLGAGNNVGMRIRMMSCGNAGKIRLRGDQHACFEDTVPKGLLT
jgi:hypothetical protein